MKQNVLMISWYNFEVRFGGTQRCLGIFENLPGKKVLLSYSKNQKDTKDYFYVYSILGGFSKYFQMLVYFSPRNLLKIYRIVQREKIDTIFAESMWTVLPLMPLKIFFDFKILFDTHNFEYEYYKQKGLLKFSKIIFRYEKFCSKISNIVFVCSDREKELFIKNYKIPANKIIVFPNGMNFPKISRKIEDIKAEIGVSDEILLSFVGKLDYLPNKEAVNFLISNINKIYGNIKIMIIGPGFENFVPCNSKKIFFLGYKENVYDYINASDVCLSPIFKGSGTRLKILEYIALNKTILSTFKGFEGLDLNKTNGVFGCEKGNFIEELNEIIKTKKYLKPEYNNKEIIKYFLWENIVKKALGEIKQNLTS